MSTVLATYNIKGGVGKTSAAVNLAALAARDGASTLLWDLDPQGAATYLFRIRPKVRGGAGKLIGLKSDVTELIKRFAYLLGYGGLAFARQSRDRHRFSSLPMV